MLIEAARRAEAAVRDMLAIANDGSATTDEFRNALGVSKSIAGINSAFQTSAASNVAGRERHGDGGAEVLADAAGLSRREAHSQVKASRVIEAAPAVRDAVEEGRIPIANAKRLADAVEETSAEVVEGDRELLAKAESMRPEQFAREAAAGWSIASRTADSQSTAASGPGVVSVSGTAMTGWCISAVSSTRSPAGASAIGCGPRPPGCMTRTRRTPRTPRTQARGARSRSAWPTPSTTSPPPQRCGRWRQGHRRHLRGRACR